jgi:hypothetical protein
MIKIKERADPSATTGNDSKVCRLWPSDERKAS